MPPHLRTAVYITGIHYGDAEDFAFLFSKWEIEVFGMEREIIFKGLIRSPRKEDIHRQVSLKKNLSLFHTIFRHRPHSRIFRVPFIEYLRFYPTPNHLRSFLEENAEMLAEM